MEINKAILRIQEHAGHTGQHTLDLKILLQCNILLSTTENVKPGIQKWFQVRSIHTIFDNYMISRVIQYI